MPKLWRGENHAARPGGRWGAIGRGRENAVDKAGVRSQEACVWLLTAERAGYRENGRFQLLPSRALGGLADEEKRQNSQIKAPEKGAV